MQADRLIGHAPRSRAFGEKLQSSPSTCIGCKDCTGVCMALIDVLMVPETILGHD